jgi:hypothetical protein
LSTDQTATGEEFVVLQDLEGHYYLLPRETIAAARVSDDSLDKLRTLLGEEVSGYAISPPQIGTASLFSQHSITVFGGHTGLNTAGINFHVGSIVF